LDLLSMSLKANLKAQQPSPPSLASLRRSPVYQAPILAMIDVVWLHQIGVQGIVLDLDNTIVSEDDRFISPHAVQWIHQAKALGLKLILVSNGKRQQRIQTWSAQLQLEAIGRARKPLPMAFRTACQRMQVPLKAVVIIGDSRHTDILGARWLGAACIQVASLPHPPRWWERLCGRWLQVPFPPDQTLWQTQANGDYQPVCWADVKD
jgi:uncharacterized protein